MLKENQRHIDIKKDSLATPELIVALTKHTTGDRK